MRQSLTETDDYKLRVKVYELTQDLKEARAEIARLKRQLATHRVDDEPSGYIGQLREDIELQQATGLFG